MARQRVILRIFGGARFELAPCLHDVLCVLRIFRGSWSVNIVKDREMAALHERSMGIGGTTDVLTFDMREGSEAGEALDLDTVVCVDEARRRAEELGHSVREELLLYCVHSLLHVQGYDDGTAAEARRMHRREDEILEAIGVGAVYDRGRKTKDERRKTKGRGA
jgi:probable rRNA maturation factor